MSISYIISQLAYVYSIIILIYCILSWIPRGRDGVLNDINSFFAKICDPFLNLFRKFIPPIGGTVDVSPIVALFVLQLVVSVLVRIF